MYIMGKFIINAETRSHASLHYMESSASRRGLCNLLRNAIAYMLPFHNLSYRNNLPFARRFHKIHTLRVAGKVDLCGL